MKDEALKLAREALLPHRSTGLRWYTEVDEALDAIDKALAQPEQEPVGVVALDTSRPFVGGSYNGQVMPWSQAPAVKTVVMFKDLPLNAPIYATPPQREWVGLTDEDKASFWKADQMTHEEWQRLFAEVEAKLKEKNT